MNKEGTEMMAVALFLSCVFISSSAQILMKMGAMKNYTGIFTYLNPYVMGGYAIFFCMTLCSTYLYRYVPLSLGNMLDSTSYLFVAGLSWVFFREKLSKQKLIGLALILLGVFFSLLGA